MNIYFPFRKQNKFYWSDLERVLKLEGSTTMKRHFYFYLTVNDSFVEPLSSRDGGWLAKKKSISISISIFDDMI